MITGSYMSVATPLNSRFRGGAGGGGGGGKDSVGRGGAGGAGGGVMGLFCRNIAGSGRISCNGGAGVSGDWDGVGAGAGGGGGGGVLMIMTATTSIPCSCLANGGAKGTPSGGTAAQDGSAGIVAILYVNTLT